MELRKTIENRRSIRHFNKNDLSKEIIDDLLDCGRLAPSAMNRQPWFFVVLKGERKDKIADIMIDWSNSTNLNENGNCSSGIEYTANVIKEANTLVLVFREKGDDWIINDNLSIGACIQNILLRAVDLGIGSLWIRHISHVQKEVEALFDYNNLELNSAIALGYTDICPKARPRKELKEIVEYYW